MQNLDVTKKVIIIIIIIIVVVVGPAALCYKWISQRICLHTLAFINFLFYHLYHNINFLFWL